MSTSTGISDLMQILSQAATPAVSSLLSSTEMQSALAKASPADLVQLSEQAMQLQETDGLFPSTNPTQAQQFGSPIAMPDATQAMNPGLEMQNVLMSIYSPGTPASTVNLLG
jgi:hypothetical protein